MSQIVPARRGRQWNTGGLPQQVLNYIRNGEITARQAHQLAGRAAPIVNRMLQGFLKQNSGGDAHDVARAAPKAGARRANRRLANITGHIHRMPGANSRGSGWDVGDFEGTTRRQQLDKMWQTTPASSNMMAPRGHGYYDAFATHPVSAMTHMSIGPATPITARSRVPNTNEFGLPSGIVTGKGQILVIIGPASSNVQGMVYTNQGTVATDPVFMNSIVATALPLKAPLQNAIPETDPSWINDGELRETIPTRCSVRIRNFTAEINRGGLVHVLRMTTGVGLKGTYANYSQGTTTNAELDQFCEAIRDHARTRTYEGTDFTGAGLQKNCVVADQSRSLMFKNYNQPIISTDVPWAPDDSLPVTGVPLGQVYAVESWEQYLYDPTFTPIAILFDPFLNVTVGPTGTPIGNSYGITVQSQFLAHYRQGTMLANLAYSPMHDVGGKLNAHRDKEESTGSTLQKIMDVAVPVMQGAAAVAPYLMAAL